MTATIRHCYERRHKSSSTQPAACESSKTQRVIFDLWELIADFEERVNRRAIQNGFFYDVSLDQASPRFFCGHTRVFSELINAMADHLFLNTPEKSLVIIQLHTVPRDKPDEYILKFLISDNSLHLSYDSLEPIFNKFTGKVLSFSDERTPGGHWICRLRPPLAGKLSIQNFYGWGNRYTIETELTAVKKFA